MKNLLSFALVLILTLGILAVAEDKTLDMSVIEKSRLYKKDRYNGTWDIYGEFEHSDSEISIKFKFGTNSQMANMKQPFMFQIFGVYKGSPVAIYKISFFVGETRYDFSDLQYVDDYPDDYAVILSGSVLRDMLSSLQSADEISFRAYFEWDGKTGWNFNLDASGKQYTESFKDLMEIAAVFEEAGAWDTFTDVYPLEQLDVWNNATRTLPEGAEEQAEPEMTVEDESDEIQGEDGQQEAVDVAEQTDEELYASIKESLQELARRNVNPDHVIYEDKELGISIELDKIVLSSSFDYGYTYFNVTILNSSDKRIAIKMTSNLFINNFDMSWYNRNTLTAEPGRNKNDWVGSFYLLTDEARTKVLEDVQLVEWEYEIYIDGELVTTIPAVFTHDDVMALIEEK